MGGNLPQGYHERFMELTALAISGELTPLEWSQLRSHWSDCAECRLAALQFRTLATQGIPALAEGYSSRQDQTTWDESAARRKLLARIASAGENQAVPAEVAAPPAISVLPRTALRQIASFAIAASLLLAVGICAYQLGYRARPSAAAISPAPESNFQGLSNEKKSLEQQLAQHSSTLARLQWESARKEQELTSLRSELHGLESRSNQLASQNQQSESQLQSVTQQRDSLNAQLQEATRNHQNLNSEIVALSSEKEKFALRASALEAKLEEASNTNREQDRRLKDAEQYLASDRDIRELMGARKLYIADVFDVDGGSHTRKPYGRVFYTQGKSLIFYAFDLDGQPGMVNASTFQVWGQKEAAQGQQPSPLNLGILYMDNETNRRWVMRFDDPKRLAEIDAVFVTVEPRGGSRKPTGKPFLYALLRNEVNHP
jgi:Anti-sigma-K factor rskA